MCTSWRGQIPQLPLLCVMTHEYTLARSHKLSAAFKSVQLSRPSCAQTIECACRGQRINQHVVIGTHGKLKGWMSKRMLDLQVLRIFVLDEADEMLKVNRTPPQIALASRMMRVVLCFDEGINFSLLEALRQFVFPKPSQQLTSQLRIWASERWKELV